MAVVVAEPLSARLRATVVLQAGKQTLGCTFEPGGKLHGVGIASPLYCKRCGQMNTWHWIAEAAELAARVEALDRLPFSDPVFEVFPSPVPSDPRRV